jgi:hypothetical protein
MFTESILKKKKQQGLIRGYRVTSSAKKGSQQKYWMQIVLQEWCGKRGYKLVPEFQFHPSRKFRFDWAVTAPGVKIAVEFEGIMSQKSRHTTTIGYSNDTIKYNEASILGWTLLRYTILTYKNLKSDLEKL